MATKHLHLLAVQIVLVGGFLWLKPNHLVPSGYWIMVFGLLFGVAVTFVEFDRD